MTRNKSKSFQTELVLNMTFGFKNHKFSQEVENTLDGGTKEQQEQMPLFGTQ